ncbi:MAG TPA: hypothetical protein VGJ26_03615 [Pirellulales bacterium]|jgi:hypothetical protein
MKATMTADYETRCKRRLCYRVLRTLFGAACCLALLVCFARSAETPKPDSPNAEAAKLEDAKTEPSKPEASKSESAKPADPTKLPASTVGLQVEIEQLVLPGTELEPAPWDDKSPVAVRVIEVFPHGTAFRYNLSYQGLEPGDYDLGKFLRRKDASSTDDLPPMAIHIGALLPPGQVQPNLPEFQSLPWLGGYRWLAIAAAVVWVAVLVWIVYPRRALAEGHAAGAAPQISLADRLRPLVAKAMAGELSPAKLSELERALVSYWRRRLDLEDLPPADALAQLKAHPDAGPLVKQLEIWLHSQAGASNVDTATLLAPYRNLPADTLEDAARTEKAPVAQGAPSR